MKPPCWTKSYPHGTKEGDEELKFFISLARNPKYQWRSVAAMAKETGLTKERVEEIIQKYYKKGMVFQNPKNEDQWGYWERCPEMLPKIEKTISRKDQDGRVDKAVSKMSIGVDGGGASSVEERWHAPAADEDYWLPIRATSNTRIETLPGGEEVDASDPILAEHAFKLHRLFDITDGESFVANTKEDKNLLAGGIYPFCGRKPLQ